MFRCSARSRGVDAFQALSCSRAVPRASFVDGHFLTAIQPSREPRTRPATLKTCFAEATALQTTFNRRHIRGPRVSIITPTSRIASFAIAMASLNRWLIPAEPKSTITPEKTVRVMQWNSLSDGLAQHGSFLKAPPGVLEWDYRWPLIAGELDQADADIMCLQEVNKDHYEESFMKHLKPRGYSGVFREKLSSPAMDFGCAPDGCAIFYKEERFSLTRCIIRNYADCEGCALNQVVILLTLQERRSGNELIVINTHLKAGAGEGADATREAEALQLLQLLREVDGAAQDGSTAPSQGLSGDPATIPTISEASISSLLGVPAHRGSGRRLPVIVCGDFNANPDSAACAAMRADPRGFKSVYAEEAKAPAADGCDGKSESAKGELFSTWKFRPAGEKTALIDFIWYAPGQGQDSTVLWPYQRWSLPTKEAIGTGALPCARYPSDHLALLCEFSWSSA